MVNAGLGKETGRGLVAKEARVVLAGRNDKEGEATEYYSNGAGKADTSQGLDNQQGKKLREGSMEVVGGTAPLMHHKKTPNLRPPDPGQTCNQGGPSPGPLRLRQSQKSLQGRNRGANRKEFRQDH